MSGCSSCGVVCWLCRWGSPAAFSLPLGVLLAEMSPEFVGCEGGLGCPSWFVILFLCLLILHHFLELGWFLVTGWWPLLRLLVLDSSDTRLHLPDALAFASPGTLGLPVRLLLPSLRLRVSKSSSLSAWSFPFRGLSLFLAFVPLLEALSESLTHSIPRSFLVVALSASAVGFADALWLCTERALRRLFASVSWLAPVALSPLLHRVFPDGFRLWCVFSFC